ncbi:MAG: hypothetical protein JWP91_4057 [Fibrobacteres bacterium]|nr:hypothetical protein [Fibrobacterota bacterium]
MGKSESHPEALIVSACLLLAGCATTHHIIPAAPLKRGESFTSANIIVPLHKFEKASFQLDNYFGIGNDLNLGIAISNFLFFLPTTVSISRYQGRDGANLAYSVFINDLFETSYSPLLEGGVSYSRMENGYPDAAYIGLGYYLPFSIFQSFWKANDHAFGSESRLSMIGQLDLGNEDAGASVRYNGNLSDYYIEYYNSGNKINFLAGDANHAGIELPYGEIAGIDTLGLEPSERMRIRLKDHSAVVIRDRDPYPDCIGCAARQRTMGAYPMGEDYAVYWIRYPGRLLNYPGLNNGFLELSLPEILSRYGEGKSIVLRQKEEFLDLKKRGRKPFFEDISFGVNYNFHGR